MTGGHQVNQTFLIVVAHWLSLLPPIPPAPPVAGGIFPAVVTRPAAMDPEFGSCLALVIYVLIVFRMHPMNR